MAPFDTSSKILKLKDQKSVFWNILPIIEKIQKWTPKNQNFENLSTTHKFYVDLFWQKRRTNINQQLKFTMQLGQLIMYYTPKTLLPFAFF